jgi:hypothetical protein
VSRIVRRFAALRRALSALALGVIVAGNTPAAAKAGDPDKPTATSDAIRVFVEDYLVERYHWDGDGDPKGQFYFPSRFTYWSLDLGPAKEPEILVLVWGGSWCGATGNCTGLILQRASCGFSLVADTTLRFPVRILPTRSHGWKDLSVSRHQNAQLNPDVVLSFDGTTYPSDGPYAGSARELGTAPKGAIKLAQHSNEFLLKQPGSEANRLKAKKCLSS